MNVTDCYTLFFAVASVLALFNAVFPFVATPFCSDFLELAYLDLM